MNKKFFLNIANLEKNIFSNEVNQLIITCIQGELNIFPGHAPLITIIIPSILKFLNKENIETTMYISGGILEVQPNSTNILANDIIKNEKLNENTLNNKKKELESTLIKSLKNNAKEFVTYSYKLSKTLAKLRVIEYFKNKKKIDN